MKNHTNTTLLRLPDVIVRTGLSKSEIYRRIKAESFPAPVKLGVRIVAWPDASIQDWINRTIDIGGAPV